MNQTGLIILFNISKPSVWTSVVDGEGESSLTILKITSTLRWSRSVERVVMKTGEGAIKRQLLSPSITARRAPPSWRPSRWRSRIQRGSWGLITDRVGQGRVWVFKVTASVFMAFSKNRNPCHYSHSCLQQNLVYLHSGPDSLNLFILLHLYWRSLNLDPIF